MSFDKSLRPKNQPTFRHRVKDMTFENSIRAYRSSPTDMHIQIRGKQKFASMALSFQEARDFAAMIIAACEDSGR